MFRVVMTLILAFSFKSYGAESRPLKLDEAIKRLNNLFSRPNDREPKRPIPVTVGSVDPNDPRGVRIQFGRFSRNEDGTADLYAVRSEYDWKYDEKRNYVLVPDKDGFHRAKNLVLPLKLQADAKGDAQLVLFPGQQDTGLYLLYEQGDQGVAWLPTSLSPVLPSAEIERPIVEFGATRITANDKNKVTYAFELKLYFLSERLATKLEIQKEGKPVLNEQGLKTYRPINYSEVPGLVEAGDLTFEKDLTGFSFEQVSP